MSEIKRKEDLIPFVSRVVIGWWYRKDDTEKIYPYISNITPYLEVMAKTLEIDLATLTSDLTSNLVYYYSDPFLGAMESTKELSHIIDDSRKIWLVSSEWDKNGKLVEKIKKETWVRADISKLYQTPSFLDDEKKITGIFKANTGWGSGIPNTVLDTLTFFPEPDSSSAIWNGNFEGYWKIFTTEIEADSYLSGLKNKPVKEKKEKTPYDDLLEKARGLKRDQIVELIFHLEEIVSEKLDSERLNPLEVALACKDKTGKIDSFIISEEYAIFDWIEQHREPRRCETIEYSDILDSIIFDYPEGVKWEDIKEEDQEIISEIADFLKNGCTGFKWDW